MRMKLFIAVLVTFFCLTQTHAEPSAGALQASNLLNPNISVIGWIQGEAGHRKNTPEADVPSAVQLKEVEIAYQAVVDPYSRADVFLSASEEGVEVEEGTLTWFQLPGKLGFKVGKFKANLGKFNRAHTPETAFADRPLIHQALFGEEGLAGAGASLSWQVPNPWCYTGLDVEVFSSDPGGFDQAFERNKNKDITTVARINSYVDITESLNATWGLSGAVGPAGNFLDVNNSSHSLHSHVTGIDLTFRWKNPRKAIYRSALWQTEIFQTRRELSPDDSEISHGLFTHLEYQWARRWRTGIRWDYAPSPIDKQAIDKGGLAYVTFTPSEFSSVSLQGRKVRKSTGDDETLGWLKMTFNMGPHGAHPF